MLPVEPASAAALLQQTVKELVGTPYKWAGTSTNGFDCSGFTQYVFKQFDTELPHYSKGQSYLGDKVEKSELRTGDLVFFNTGGFGISHVGIYIGDGKFVHASTDAGVVISRLDETYYAKRYVTARRILDEKTYLKVAVEKTEKEANS
ncbi:C40 family peptidase [Paenibacillaceae bacterium T2]|uniref:C40 family peptidase n=1 Tax=Ferviditalea candida TaxID=3108399 RepID=A0ABU5ZH87_9BACL|nr:C40 family peptidase [Paenibacillaceae bacterium T2]